MTHDITALQRHNYHWHAASGRLYRVTRHGSQFEATHTASWYTGRGTTIEAAINDAARGWNGNPPIMPF